jgi:PPM family protein phosphatase
MVFWRRSRERSAGLVRIPHAFLLERYGPVLQDRVAVIETGSALVLAVADGAGGRPHGGCAADLVSRGLETLVGSGAPLDQERTWRTFLAETDRAIGRDPEPGETTAVVLAVTPGMICGASVGDSEAWLITPQGRHALTAHQRRKPMLGSGAAMPVSFRLPHAGGTLLVGSDGLFKYAPGETIRESALGVTPESACTRLIDLVRLPGGQLQDDVAVVVCHLPGPV